MADPAGKKDEKKFKDAAKKLTDSWDDLAKELAAGKNFAAEVHNMSPDDKGNDKTLKLADFKADAIEKILKQVEAAIKTVEAAAK